MAPTTRQYSGTAGLTVPFALALSKEAATSTADVMRAPRVGNPITFAVMGEVMAHGNS